MVYPLRTGELPTLIQHALPALVAKLQAARAGSARLTCSTTRTSRPATHPRTRGETGEAVRIVYQLLRWIFSGETGDPGVGGAAAGILRTCIR